MKPRVLIVDDDPGVLYTIKEILESLNIDISAAEDGIAALKSYDENTCELVITDLRMPRMDGIELLKQLLTKSPPPKVIVITAHGSERQAVEAIKAGAYDYFRKPFENDELLAVVQRALETVRLTLTNEQLQGELALSQSLIFTSSAMRKLATLVARVAPRDVTVLITGESGTGKERVAEAIVRASQRHDKPFIKFNCAALTVELAEAELFGHARGAFTGATRTRPGLFGEADGGTLLLDEIGELAPAMQSKLLRALQEGEIRPVGEERIRKVDVRVIAATHQDLKAKVAVGQFREDLFYRLNVVHIKVPTLRERPEDIATLAKHFLKRSARRFNTGELTTTDELFQRLRDYNWPGNVRELENAIENLVALSCDGHLDLSLLPNLQHKTTIDDHSLPSLKTRVEAFERGLICEALHAAHHNQSAAARELGISRVTLNDKMKKYGLRGE
ncbi:MAG: sigma-54-dependent Fis family transcriptional regulator [Deltaproteobacteria bacterium]|nr:sigma-54-dependent Fis family transcriptional regulator [Deltaproteobacteria bacterium]